MWSWDRPAARWSREAAACLRFTPDRRAVRRELEAHIDDCADALTARGMGPEQAALDAAARMGDPQETGRLLNRVHSPLLGWAWYVSKWLLLAAVLLGAVLALTLQEVRDLPYWWKEGSKVAFYTQFYEQDVLETGSALRNRWTPETTPVRAGAYRFSVTDAALRRAEPDAEGIIAFPLGPGWSTERYEAAREGGINVLYLSVKAAYDLPWQGAPALNPSDGMTLYDDLGNVYDPALTLGERRQVRTEWSREGFLSATLQLEILDVPAQAHWLRLDYQWHGAAFALTVPLDWGGAA